MWLRLGPRSDPTRRLVGGLLLLVGLFILGTGTGITVQQMGSAPPPHVCGAPVNLSVVA